MRGDAGNMHSDFADLKLFTLIHIKDDFQFTGCFAETDIGAYFGVNVSKFSIEVSDRFKIII